MSEPRPGLRRNGGQVPPSRTSVGASFISLAATFLCFAPKVASRSCRCSSFPQKVTLGSPARLQATSLRLAVANNFLRGNVLSFSLFAPFFEILRCGQKCSTGLSYNLECLGAAPDSFSKQWIMPAGESVDFPRLKLSTKCRQLEKQNQKCILILQRYNVRGDSRPPSQSPHADRNPAS